MRIIDSEPHNRGNSVALVVEALHYNPEGRGFDGVIGIFHWNYPSGHYGPVVDSASNRIEYQEYFLDT